MRREAVRSGSMALGAEATHLQTNVVQAGTIIAGLLLVGATGEEVFDPLVALGLAAYMGWTAIGLVRAATEEIMDAALPDDDLAQIHDVLVAAPGPDPRLSPPADTPRSARLATSICICFWPASYGRGHPEISEAVESEITERLPGTR